MLRSAAKNFAAVYALVDPADYESVLRALEAGDDDLDLRRLPRGEGVRAHGRVRRSDRALVRAAATESSFRRMSRSPSSARRHCATARIRASTPPFTSSDRGAGLAGLTQRGGRGASFNNLLDLEGALFATDPFAGRDRCAIIKHTTPVRHRDRQLRPRCVSKGARLRSRCRRSGRSSRSRCRWMTRRPRRSRRLFVECIVAPTFSQRRWRSSVARRTCACSRARRVAVPTRSTTSACVEDFSCRSARRSVTMTPVGASATSREPTNEEHDDLRFAWRAVASVKSNAIVLARGRRDHRHRRRPDVARRRRVSRGSQGAPGGTRHRRLGARLATRSFHSATVSIRQRKPACAQSSSRGARCATRK